MNFSRRSFLKSAASVAPLLAWEPLLLAQGLERAHEGAADVIIVGAGVGGCAAAWAACRAGLRVILTEETDWIGGQPC